MVETVRVELANAGTVPWGDRMRLSYHWLDDRDNPIVWDGTRSDVPRLRPGEQATVEARVRAPMPPGPYRLAFDMVAEQRAWFSELGCPTLSIDLDVIPRSGEPRADLPPQLEAAPGLGGARSRGARRGLRRRRRRDRVARITSPSCARAVRAGTGARAGLRRPAARAVGAAGDRARAARRPRGPARVRGAARRAVGLRRPDRAQSSTAIRSSTRVKTYAPSASAAAAATTR